MHNRLRTSAQTILLFLTIVVCLYGLTRLSLLTQRVDVSRSPNNLLLKSGIPLQRSDAGTITQDPGFFWGRLEYSEFEQIRVPNNLAAKSGISLSEQTDQAEMTIGGRSSAHVASLSGPTWYDPHISVGEAMNQVPRIATERQLDETQVAKLVRQYTEGTWFGLLGEPRVNVRDLNRALELMTGG